jgi:hypothetical protein
MINILVKDGVTVLSSTGDDIVAVTRLVDGGSSAVIGVYNIHHVYQSRPFCENFVSLMVAIHTRGIERIDGAGNHESHLPS